MSARRLEWVVAGGLAGWAAARLAGADRGTLGEALVVPVLSFTPQMAACAWASMLLVRGRGPAAATAAAGVALTAAVAPRAIPRRQPEATGPVLRVLTANLLVGHAAADAVVALVRQRDADVLFVQELTSDAADRLQSARLGELLGHQVIQPRREGAGGSGIYARHVLTGEPAAAAGLSAARCTARLQLPSGRAVQVVCIHAPPPKPWSARGAARWRTALAALPPPGELPSVLAGDFNATLDHAELRSVLRRGYVDVASEAGRGLIPTWGPEPHGRPGLLTIDHILADARCAVGITSVHRLPGTDHRAVYAELRLPA
jgi:endonuclease/exonuclease/phosphatase family metal-dependent hydrolase